MADTNNPAGDGANQDPNAGGADPAGSQGAGDQGADNNGGDGDGSGQKADPPANPQPKDPQMRNAFFAGKRVAAKQFNQQQNQQNQNQSPDGGEGGSNSDGGNGQGDQNQSPDVNAQVQEALSPILQQQQAVATDNDITKIVSEYPELSEFSDTVRNWAAHESRANVPIQTLFLEAAGTQKLMEIGYARGVAAAEKQNDSQASGNASRTNTGTGKKVSEMTDAEFEAEQARVRSQG